MLRNKYTDTSVQKEEIPGFSMSSTPVQWPNYSTKLESTTTTWKWYGLT